MAAKFRVMLVYPRRDPESNIRTQFSQEQMHGLVIWPFKLRTYGLAFNGLETLASLTPDWVDLTVVNENLDDIDFQAPVDVVAITVMVTNATRACQIADRFRERGVKVLMGGYYPYMVPDHSLLHADAICASEAEGVWEQMLKDARDGCLKQKYEQPNKTEMGDLCHVPRPTPGRWLRHVTLTLQASRGCPFDCEFCSIVQMLGHDMRYKKPESIIAELEQIYKHDLMGRWAGRPIFFVDDNIFGNPRQFKETVRGIIKLNRKYPKFKALFGSQLTINVSKDKEALALMQEAGFYNVFIGLESTNVEILKAYNKLHNLAFNYDEAISRIREYRMEVVASFIFGTDGDTEECFERAFNFFDRNNILYPYFNILTPIGRQWKRFMTEGRILTVKPRLYDAHHTVFIPAKMRPIDLQKGFIDLVNKVLSYDQIKKRLLNAPVKHTSHRMEVHPLWQKALYHKLTWTLGQLGDQEGVQFMRDLKPNIMSGALPIIPVLAQLDQHDFAVRNRLTLDEHRFKLDVPPWEARSADKQVAVSVAAAVAAAVR